MIQHTAHKSKLKRKPGRFKSFLSAFLSRLSLSRSRGREWKSPWERDCVDRSDPNGVKGFILFSL